MTSVERKRLTLEPLLLRVFENPKLTKTTGGLNVGDLRFLLEQSPADPRGLKRAQLIKALRQNYMFLTDETDDDSDSDSDGDVKDGSVQDVTDTDTTKDDLDDAMSTAALKIATSKTLLDQIAGGVGGLNDAIADQASSAADALTSNRNLNAASQFLEDVLEPTIPTCNQGPVEDGEFTQNKGSVRCVSSRLQDILFEKDITLKKNVRNLGYKCRGRWVDIPSISGGCKSAQQLFRDRQGYRIVSFTFAQGDDDRWWCFDSRVLMQHVRGSLAKDGIEWETESDHQALMARPANRFPRIKNPARRGRSSSSSSDKTPPRKYLNKEDVRRLRKHEQTRRVIDHMLSRSGSNGGITVQDCDSAVSMMDAQDEEAKTEAAPTDEDLDKLKRFGNHALPTDDLAREAEMGSFTRLVSGGKRWLGDVTQNLPFVGRGGRFRRFFTDDLADLTWFLLKAQIVRTFVCAALAGFFVLQALPVGTAMFVAAAKITFISFAISVMSNLYSIALPFITAFGSAGLLAGGVAMFAGLTMGWAIEPVVRAMHAFAKTMFPDSWSFVPTETLASGLWASFTTWLPSAGGWSGVLDKTLTTGRLMALLSDVANIMAAPFRSMAAFATTPDISMTSVLFLLKWGPRLMCDLLPSLYRFSAYLLNGTWSMLSRLRGASRKENDASVRLLAQMDAVAAKVTDVPVANSLCSRLTEFVARSSAAGRFVSLIWNTGRDMFILSNLVVGGALGSFALVGCAADTVNLFLVADANIEFARSVVGTFDFANAPELDKFTTSLESRKDMTVKEMQTAIEALTAPAARGRVLQFITPPKNTRRAAVLHMAKQVRYGSKFVGTKYTGTQRTRSRLKEQCQLQRGEKFSEKFVKRTKWGVLSTGFGAVDLIENTKAGIVNFSGSVALSITEKIQKIKDDWNEAATLLQEAVKEADQQASKSKLWGFIEWYVSN